MPFIVWDAGNSIYSGFGARYQPTFRSQFGQGLLEARQQGRGTEYAHNAVLNAGTFGIYGLFKRGSEAVEYYQETGDPTALYELGGSLLALGATYGVGRGVGSLSGRIAGGISRAWEGRGPRRFGTAESPVWTSSKGDLVVDSAALPGSNGILVPRRLTVSEMESLSSTHGVEFSLVYKTGPGASGSGGAYRLYSGSINRVRVPLGSDVRWIYHTHPGGTPYASGFPGDQNVLWQLQQAGSPQQSSVVIPVGGAPFRFNVNSTRLP